METHWYRGYRFTVTPLGKRRFELKVYLGQIEQYATIFTGSAKAAEALGPEWIDAQPTEPPKGC